MATHSPDGLERLARLALLLREAADLIEAELAPRVPGRAMINDAPALERMAELLDADPGLRIHTAAMITARELAEPMTTLRSTAARLAGKYRRMQEELEGV
jgi:hypothetical protein